MSIRICSVGSCLAEHEVSNAHLSTFLDTSDEWIVSRTGINTRRVSTGEGLTDLGANAAQQALERAGLQPGDIDLVIGSTVVGDYFFPSFSCCVAKRLGITAPAFDINAACSGFLYALDVAAGFLARDRARNILIVSGEMMSTLADWTDRSTCVLFGDGAGAAIVTAGDSLRYLKIAAKPDTDVLYMNRGTGNSPFRPKSDNGFVVMQGQEVFKFAVSAIENDAKEALDVLSLTLDDIDYYLLHQANLRIIDFARTRLKQPVEKFPLSIDHCGNMSSASLPILLDKLSQQGKLVPGTRLFLCAFGAGLTSASAVLEWA